MNNELELLNKNINNTINCINNFQGNQREWSNFFNNVNKTYSHDFSVLLKQNVIDTFKGIHKKKEEILAANLCLLQAVQKERLEFSRETIVALENIRSLSEKIAILNFGKKFLNYGVEVNKIIAFFKTLEGNVYENQLAEAKKILVLWNELLAQYNEIIISINEIRKELELILNDKNFQ